jgi:hypothetical protein
MKNFVIPSRLGDDEAVEQALKDAAFGGGMQALGAIGPIGKVIAAVIGFAVAIAQTVKARKAAEKEGLEAMRRAVFARMPPMQQPSTFTDDFLIRDKLLPGLQGGDWTDIFSPRFESDTGEWVGIKRRYGYAFAPGRKTHGKDEVGEDADVFDPGVGLGIIPGMDQLTSVVQVSLDPTSSAVKAWQANKTLHWPVQADHVVDVGQFYVNTGRLGSVAWAWATQQDQSLDLYKLYVGKHGGPGKNHLHARWKKYCEGGIQFLLDNAKAWVDGQQAVRRPALHVRRVDRLRRGGLALLRGGRDDLPPGVRPAPARQPALRDGQLRRPVAHLPLRAPPEPGAGDRQRAGVPGEPLRHAHQGDARGGPRAAGARAAHHAALRLRARVVGRVPRRRHEGPPEQNAGAPARASRPQARRPRRRARGRALRRRRLEGPAAKERRHLEPARPPGSQGAARRHRAERRAGAEGPRGQLADAVRQAGPGAVRPRPARTSAATARSPSSRAPRASPWRRASGGSAGVVTSGRRRRRHDGHWEGRVGRVTSSSRSSSTRGAPSSATTSAAPSSAPRR